MDEKESRLISKFERIKDKIRQERERRAKLEGQLQHILGALEDEFGCSSLADAEKELARIRKRAARLTDAIENRIQELENALEV